MAQQSLTHLVVAVYARIEIIQLVIVTHIALYLQ